MTVEKLKAARQELKRAEQTLITQLKKTHRIGSFVTYERGGRCLRGEVIGHGMFHPDLRVRNVHTGKEYWITLYDIYGMTP